MPRKGSTTIIPYGDSKIQKAVKLHIFKSLVSKLVW